MHNNNNVRDSCLLSLNVRDPHVNWMSDVCNGAPGRRNEQLRRRRQEEFAPTTTTYDYTYYIYTQLTGQCFCSISSTLLVPKLLGILDLLLVFILHTAPVY